MTLQAGRVAIPAPATPDAASFSRAAASAEIATTMTSLMDEERALDASKERKDLLADFGDFRAPLGLAVAHLNGFEQGGDPALHAEFAAALAKAERFFIRIGQTRHLMTATQAAGFGRVEVLFAALVPELRSVKQPASLASSKGGSSPAEPSFALANGIFKALTVMLDAERSLPGTAERKRLVGAIVDVRGPLGIATSHLRDYVRAGEPSRRRLYEQFRDRSAAALIELTALAPILSPEQAQAFATVLRDWPLFLVAARATLARRNEAEAVKGFARWTRPSLLLPFAPAIALLPAFLVLLPLADGAQAPRLAAAALLAAAGFLAHAALVRRTLIRPLDRAMAGLRALASGEAAEPIAAGDALSGLGHAAERVRLSLLDLQGALAASLAEVRNQTLERREAMMRLSESFAGNIGSAVVEVESETQRLHAQVRQIRGIAQKTRAAADSVDRAGTGATDSLAGVSLAVDQWSAAAIEIKQRADRSLHLAEVASTSSNRASTMIQGLGEEAARIAGAVGQINQIAASTQMLALNATIEASRAGESGRGFAVVAAEVKALARTTAEMTAHISGLVASIAEKTGLTTQAIDAIHADLSEFHAIARDIATATAEQTMAAGAVVDAVSFTRGEVTGMAGSIGGLTGELGDVEAAALDLEALAGNLSRRAATLDTFVTQVQRA